MNPVRDCGLFHDLAPMSAQKVPAGPGSVEPGSVSQTESGCRPG